MKNALEICLDDKMTAEEKYEMLLDLGLDLEDMIEFALKAGEIQCQS